MLVAYPTFFYYDDTDESGSPYFVYVPDLDGCTQGETIPNAMAMGAEIVGILVSDLIEKGQEIPKPSDINRLSLVNNNPFKDDGDLAEAYNMDKSFISLVGVDVSEYLGSQEPIKKTLTIPRWADKLGRELGLNFSQTLTDAIAERKLQA